MPGGEAAQSVRLSTAQSSVLCVFLRKPHAMALNFGGFSIPASQNSCGHDAAQEGKCDEELGLDFSSDKPLC